MLTLLLRSGPQAPAMAAPLAQPGGGRRREGLADIGSSDAGPADVRLLHHASSAYVLLFVQQSADGTLLYQPRQHMHWLLLPNLLTCHWMHA